MTLSEPRLDISNSFLLQLIISNCIYAFKIEYCPLIQMYSLFQCMLPQTMCSCCGTLHFLELFTYLCTSTSFPTKRTLSILSIMVSLVFPNHMTTAMTSLQLASFWILPQVNNVAAYRINFILDLPQRVACLLMVSDSGLSIQCLQRNYLEVGKMLIQVEFSI